jgi:hypothetical protein
MRATIALICIAAVAVAALDPIDFNIGTTSGGKDVITSGLISPPYDTGMLPNNWPQLSPLVRLSADVCILMCVPLNGHASINHNMSDLCCMMYNTDR